MTNKHLRNINQIKHMGENPKLYFLRKLREECKELYLECEGMEELIENQVDYQGTSFEKKLKSEWADVQNCLMYIKSLFEWNGGELAQIMEFKQDVAWRKLVLGGFKSK